MTPERVSRADDERLYQPRIHSKHIRALHRISQELGEPITVLVDRALEAYVERYRQSCYGEEGNGLENERFSSTGQHRRTM